MGRSQKHSNSPLFKLRQQLGRSRPITQEALADLISVPLPTIQSLEMGRIKKLTPELFQKIVTTAWSVWDEKTQLWIFKYSIPPLPVTAELFDQYREFVSTVAPIPESDPEVIKMRIDALFGTVAKDRWMELFWRIQAFLEKCAEDIGLMDEANLGALFKITEDKIHSGGRAGLNDYLQRSYAWPAPIAQLKSYYRNSVKHYKELVKVDPKGRSDFMMIHGTADPEN